MNQDYSKIAGVIFWPLKKHCDDRGWLIELWRADNVLEQDLPEMTYISMTLPGVVRGPHEHQDQSDLFCFIGPGDFELHLWTKPSLWTKPYEEIWQVGESNPMAVLVPPGVVHAYKNVSVYPGYVTNSPNRLYGGPDHRYPVDEIRHESGTTYKMPTPANEKVI